MNSDKIMFDVIIVNYKSTDFLYNSLKSLSYAMKNIPARISVQNNDTKDGLECVKAMFPDVEFARNKYNMGFAKAINRALEKSDSKYIVLINPDTVVKNGFFESVLDYMENNPEVGIVGPKILCNDGSVQGSARSFPNILSACFGRTSILTRLFPNNPISKANILTTCCDGKTPIEVDWLSGACLVVRRDALNEVGSLDERFFMYWEDVDWCKRMWTKGWKIVYYPKATITHYVGGSSEKRIYQSVLEFHKSAYYFSNKHMKPPLVILRPIYWLTCFTGILARFMIVLLLKISMAPFNSDRQSARYDEKPC